MKILKKIRRIFDLEEYASSDGFEYIGDGLVLFFVAGLETEEVRRDFVLCNSVRQAKRELKTRRAAGWQCCWKMFGQVHLIGDTGEQ